MLYSWNSKKDYLRLQLLFPPLYITDMLTGKTLDLPELMEIL